jgi:site-specific DNA-methyltransferase (cytosine-N4-specific)
LTPASRKNAARSRDAQDRSAEAGPSPTDPVLAYKTDLGEAWIGESRGWLHDTVDSDSVDLVVTSPPFALANPKEYGNQSQQTYVQWLTTFADEIHRVLKPTGSFVLDLGPAWIPGSPTKSLYQFEVLLALCKRPTHRFHLAQDFYWFNTAKLPSPAQWVTIERVRAKDAVNCVWWLSKTERPKADNSRVLTEYTPAMKKLLETGQYNRGKRPSGHDVGEGFNVDRGGAIPPNLLALSNSGEDPAYSGYCKAHGLTMHPARFPRALPEFFIRMLTDEGDLVVDPFGGSNTTGAVAETLGRLWRTCEQTSQYVEGSRGRFEALQYTLPQ